MPSITKSYSDNMVKLGLLLSLYCLIVFNYSILRVSKDTLLVTAPGSGASAIPYIKVWAILPITFLTVFFFTKLSNKYSHNTVFYIVIFCFAFFFFIFPIFLYPITDYIHPHLLADRLQLVLPEGFGGLISIFRNWSYSLFYSVCDLWGSVVMTMLFWGYTNSKMSVSEAKNFYTILGVGANVSTMLAGQVGMAISGRFLHQASGDRWGQSIYVTCMIVVILSLIIALLYYQLTKDDLPMDTKQSPKIIMGLQKNLTYLRKSRYLLCLATMVIMYNISLNLMEIVWKHEAHKMYPNAADYNMYMNKAMWYLGITSTMFALLMIWGNVLNNFSWTVVAAVTPTICFVSGLIFFFFITCQNIPIVALLLGTNPASISMFVGGIQNCLARASKFTFFDITKEMSFIPLSKESKIKGKYSIDGLVSRVGKSGGSIIYQALLLLYGNINSIIPFISTIFFLSIISWCIAVKSLGKRFNKLLQKDLLARN